MPEQPPPFTPSRTPERSLLCARLDSCALICCAARGVTLTDNSAIPVPLLFPVGDGGLDGVFRQYRAVDLHRRQRELFRDLLVGHRERLVHRLAFHPLGDERRRGDGRPAAKGLELGVLDLAV